MPMMNSDARKRAQSSSEPRPVTDPVARAVGLADAWDREADTEETRGNGIAAVILHAHADELRAALAAVPLSA